MDDKTLLAYVQDTIDSTEQSLRYLKFIERELGNRSNGTKILVQFAGCTKKYAYYVPEGYVRVGDYVRVHSNYTNKQELVKVIALGDGGYNGMLKNAELLSE